eukprot:jgi/Chlat1/8318/Chrsp78S07741
MHARFATATLPATSALSKGHNSNVAADTTAHGLRRQALPSALKPKSSKQSAKLASTLLNKVTAMAGIGSNGKESNGHSKATDFKPDVEGNSPSGPQETGGDKADTAAMRADAGKEAPFMTGANGRPIGDNQNSMTAGPRGPLLIEDYWHIEKMQHFNRERIPERVVHAKGAGAYGTFTVTNDLTKYTKAAFLSEVGKETEVLARFSTVGGEKGSSDVARDPRGFSLKFYTEQGNWDMVGNNTPVFFIRDPLKFSDFIRTQKRHPQSNLKPPIAKWDYWGLSPEAVHQVTILMSDRGIPKGFRHMNGYGSHTFSWINDEGVRHWVKFHFKTMQGIENLTEQEAADISGTNPDYSTEDLFEAINKGENPKWKFQVQIMPEHEAETYKVDPFDLTKVWNHSDYPLIDVGILELNRNVKNYFAEIEQSAFSPSNFVPGIGPSPDKVLQSRLLSYSDAHLYRIGTNYETLPVNAPKCPMHTYHRDGAMRFDDNGGDSPNYEPNSFGGPKEDPRYKDPVPPVPVNGPGDRYSHRAYHNQAPNDDYTQAGDLFRLMKQDEKERLITGICVSMKEVPRFIQERNIVHFYRCDPAYGEGIANGLGVDISTLMDKVKKPEAVAA